MADGAPGPDRERSADDDVLDLASAAAPGLDLARATVVAGEFHDVVLVPGVTAVKVARGAAAQHLGRRAALLSRLAGLGLPFAVPRPLGEVVTARAHGRRGPTAPGRRQGRRPPTAGGGPGPPPVPPSLVHGDLAGANVLLGGDGRVVGVLDWDLAQPFDPAVDAACLAWFGWPVVGAAVHPDALRRARVWHGVFPVEQVAAALDNSEDRRTVDGAVRRATAWIARQESSGSVAGRA
nr:phosphotransferase [uncultured Actinotalea sp.]